MINPVDRNAAQPLSNIPVKPASLDKRPVAKLSSEESAVPSSITVTAQDPRKAKSLRDRCNKAISDFQPQFPKRSI